MNACGFQTYYTVHPPRVNERGELTTTLFCLISVGYHLELRVAMTFYRH
jgi:hypothetical protein